MERTFGWRHFRALQKRGKGKDTFVLLAATCDEATQLWVRCRGWRAGSAGELLLGPPVLHAGDGFKVTCEHAAGPCRVPGGY